MTKKIVIFSLLIFNISKILAQDFIRFERITIKDGLSQNTVNCVLQDRIGYVWIGTLDGLNRYNGIDFETYKNDVNNPFSIKSNSISSLYEDSEGTLWIGTRKGLHYFNRQREEFFSITDTTLNPIGNRVTCIIEDKNKNLWIAYEGNGIAKLDLKANPRKLVTYAANANKSSGIISNNIYTILYNKNTLWLGSDGSHLISFDITTSQFTTYPFPITNDNKDDAILHLAPDEKGNIWISTYLHGIFIFDVNKKEFTPFKTDHFLLKNYNIARIFHDDSNKEMWIATQGNGIIKYDKEKDTFIPFQFDPTNQESLSNNDVTYIYKDRSDLFWIGTYNGGLNKYDPSKNKFKHFKKEANNPNSLSANGMRGIFEDSKGRLWIGTTLGGLNMIDRRTGKYTLFSTQSPIAISDDRINVITEDKYGNIWVGTLNKGLNKITFEGDKIKVKLYQNEAENPNSLPHISIRSLLYDANREILWVGTLNGLSKFDLVREKFENYNTNTHLDSLSNGIVKQILQDNDENILWLATDNGLNKMYKNEKKFRRYLHNDTNPKSISTNGINCLHLDKKGELWIGTVGGGLNHLDKNTEHFTYFTEKNGLPNNVIYGILEDDKGNLWCSTNKGLFKFNPKNGETYTYYEEDGLQSNEFNLYAFHKNRMGEMFFGGINGFNSFFPNSIITSSYQPNVVLTDFKIANQSIKTYDGLPLASHISLTKEISLSYENNVFSLDFASLDFKSPTKIKYKYKMEGFDKDWRETNYKRRTDTYTNLPEGTYYFKVRATNSDGVWSNKEANLKITITPPFWKTLIFRIGVSISLLGLFIYIYKQRIRQIEAQKGRLEQQVAQRTNEINLQKEEIHNQKNELEKLFNDIKTLSVIGQEITATLELQAIISTVYENVNQLMDADGLGIGLYVKENRSITFEGFMENGKPLAKFVHSLDDEQRFSVWCFLNQREVFLNDIENEYQKYISQRQAPIMGQAAQSIIYVPLFIENHPIGVLTVQSFKKNAYHQQQLELLKNLASYIAIAIDNANNYKQLEIAKRTIEERNRYTTDSIRYAQTIQHSILPTNEMLDSYFGKDQHFLIYKAKDLVSGDFYWCKNVDNRTFFAVVDCTGHGVPGAFMSMIGSTLLNEIISQHPHYSPAEILEEMNTLVRSVLRQEDKYNDDGMDMGICLLEQNGNKKKLIFAGAQFPLYLVRNEQISKFKGENRSIGGRQREKEHQFINTEVGILQEGDMLYLLTDGFTDQNDVHRIKYGSNRIQEKLSLLASQPLRIQKEQLEDELFSQLEGTEQRDDITILGVKI